MKTSGLLICSIMLLITAYTAYSQDSFEKDIIMTDSGELELWFIGHGTLMLKYYEKN